MWRASWDPTPRKKIKTKVVVVVEAPVPEVLELHPQVEALRNGKTKRTTTRKRR